MREGCKDEQSACLTPPSKNENSSLPFQPFTTDCTRTQTYRRENTSRPFSFFFSVVFVTDRLKGREIHTWVDVSTHPSPQP
jgi:hypothetical protein